MSINKPSVIIRYDERGEVSYHATIDVDLYIIDERFPHDRVYKYTSSSFPNELEDLIGPGPIGHGGDDKQVELRRLMGADADKGN